MRWFQEALSLGIAAGLIAVTGEDGALARYRLDEWRRKRRALLRKGIVI